MNIFIDLEETVIDEFGNNPIFLGRFLGRRCKSVSRIIEKSMNVEKIFIFSFAIATPEELLKFNHEMRDELCTRLNISSIDAIVTVPQMMDCTEAIHHPRFKFHGDLFEFSCARGKSGAFDDWCMKNHLGQNNVLIDDMVRNRITVDADTDTTIQTINIVNFERNGG